MEVQDHEPQSWFLFKEGDALFIDAPCEHGAVGYNVLIQLNEQEISAYASEGRVYLSRLAQEIHESAPGVIGSRSPYKQRNVLKDHAAATMLAVERWRSRAK
jgi:hypothetical protein